MVHLNMLLEVLKPLSHSVFSGDQISCPDQAKYGLNVEFGQAMSSIKSVSILDVLVKGLHMTHDAFADWRQFVETKAMITRIDPDTGETYRENPRWYCDLDPVTVSTVIAHIKKHTKAIDVDSHIRDILYKVGIDFDKYFKAVDSYVNMGRGEKRLPVFIPVAETDWAPYSKMEMADGSNQEKEKYIKLVCVDIGAVLQRYFYRNRKLVFSSGSWIQPDFDIRRLGLAKDDVAVVRVPTTFKPASRPVYCFGSVDFSSKLDGEYLYRSNAETWIKELDFIVSRIWASKPGVNIVIHTHSFAVSRVIAENANIDDNWYFHVNKLNKEQWFNNRSMMEASQIKKDDGVSCLKNNHGKGLVLVSPSVKEGVDFKYGAARAQIIVKAPIPYWGDAFVQAMTNGVPELEIAPDKLFGDRRVLRDLTQMYGRVMRSPDDGGLTFILDVKLHEILTRAWFNRNFHIEYLKEGLRAEVYHEPGFPPVLKWLTWSGFNS